MRSVVCLLVLALVSAGCGARLDQAQKVAANGQGRGGGNQTGAVATGAKPSSTVPAAGSGAVATSAGSGGGSTPGVEAGPSGPASAEVADFAGATCVPSGGATDVGVTDTSVTTGSVATVGGPVPGLFENVQGGVKAYFNMINSTEGGVCGRKLQGQFNDDRLDASVNRSATQELKDKVFAFVGSYSVLDDAGATVLSGSGIPDIGSSIGDQRNAMAENFSMTPTSPDHSSLGNQPLMRYLQAHYGVTRAVMVWPAQADARHSGQLFVGDMKAVGIDVVDTLEVAVTETNYTGVAQKIANDKADLLITVLEINGISRLANALQQVGYHPTVSMWGQQSYGQLLIKLAGPAVEGTILPLGHDIVENSASDPEVARFAEWFSRTNPGADPDFFAIQGWIAGSMFVRALRQAGAQPTRAKVLAALQGLHDFDADGLIPKTDVASKTGSGCFHIVTIEGGQWKVVDPVSGFTC